MSRTHWHLFTDTASFLFVTLANVAIIQLVTKLWFPNFFFSGFSPFPPRTSPLGLFWAGADTEGVLLSSRQTDGQVEAQLKTLGSRHVRNKTVHTASAILSSAHISFIFTK